MSSIRYPELGALCVHVDIFFAELFPLRSCMCLIHVMLHHEFELLTVNVLAAPLNNAFSANSGFSSIYMCGLLIFWLLIFIHIRYSEKGFLLYI